MLYGCSFMQSTSLLNGYTSQHGTNTSLYYSVCSTNVGSRLESGQVRQRVRLTHSRVRPLPQDGPAALSKTDLVFAIPTHKATEAQLKAGRSLRKVNKWDWCTHHFSALFTWAFLWVTNYTNHILVPGHFGSPLFYDKYAIISSS